MCAKIHATAEVGPLDELGHVIMRRVGSLFVEHFFIGPWTIRQSETTGGRKPKMEQFIVSRDGCF